MPGYIIHLAEAELIIDRLLKEGNAALYTQEWQERFRRGCLLPDGIQDKEKEETHFWNVKDTDELVRLPDLELFIRKYWWKLIRRGKYPEVYGYFVHLCLDRMFFEKYLPEQILRQDARGYPLRSYKGMKSVIIRKTGERISAKELFSKEYLYGDYTTLNEYLINKYQIVLPDDERQDEGKNKDEFCDMSIADVIQNLNRYMAEGKSDDGGIMSEKLSILDRESLELFLKSVSDVSRYRPSFLGSVFRFVLPFDFFLKQGKRISLWLKHRRLISCIRRCVKTFLDYGLYSSFVLLLSFFTGLISGRKGIEVLCTAELMNDTRLSKETKAIRNNLTGKIIASYSVALAEENTLIFRWQKQWYRTAEEGQKNFADFFVKIFRDTERLYKKNRSKNFIFKYLYISIMVLALIGFCIFCVFNMQNVEIWSHAIAENSILLVVILLALTIISKWLDIKKYQETWVRHYNHLYRLNKEMMRYLYGMDEYAVTEKNTQSMVNQAFMKKIFEIEDENVKKFIDNMENKEVRIGEGIKSIFTK